MNTKPDFHHILITRFSVRLSADSAFQGRSSEWLFNVERLKQKLVLFEHVTLASVLAGSAQPDSYLILIDTQLPDEILKSLKSLTEPYPWIQLNALNPGDLTKMQQLSGFGNEIKKQCHCVVTTNLDDDDALGIDYLKNLRAHVAEGIKKNQFGRFHWFGSIDMQEWDILPCSDAPLGFVKPYSGGVLFTLSTGYSVFTQNHNLAPTIFTLSHSRCLDYLTTKHRRVNFDAKGRRKFALTFCLRAARMGAWVEMFKFLAGQPFATRLDTDLNATFEGLIINHGDNLQGGRIKQGMEVREPLSPELLDRKFGVRTAELIDEISLHAQS